MDAGGTLKNRGQISIEFMFLILVSVIYINGVLFPIANAGEQTLTEVYELGLTQTAARKLLSNVQLVSNQSDSARQTITALIPTNGSITCIEATDAISFTYTLRQAAPSCANSTTCTKTIPAGVNIVCDPANFSITGPKHVEFEISQLGGQVTIKVASETTP